ncbi:membrane protein [Staphylococcus gallinarum]|uniref:Membrane protein n=1 Tax=Staphylococcus gallinarum TaxID=1293 RepID=A0A380FHP6_STAGA|nr:membrane protein [Staphylococcus gallinarum]
MISSFLLPLLLWSIERILKRKQFGWFIVIVTLSLVNNFYFAYYQLLTGLIYFLLELFFVINTIFYQEKVQSNVLSLPHYWH